MNINDVLTAWIELDADPLAVARRLGITVEQLARKLEDPKVRELLDAVDDLRARHHRQAARSAQLAASEHLRRTLDEAPTPIERRRAATTLARLAHQMLQASSKAPASLSSPAASGGGGRGSGGGARPEGEVRAHPTSKASPTTPPPPRGRAPGGGFEGAPTTTIPHAPNAPSPSTTRPTAHRPSPSGLLAAAGAP